MPHMSTNPLYDAIMARLAELGLKPNRASLMATDGKNRDLIRKLKDANVMPSAAHAEGLATVLGWDVADLVRAAETGIPPKSSRPRGATPSRLMIPALDSLPADVPVMGVAAGAAVGSFVIDGPIDWVRRPPAMANARNLYALYVTGESMVPRFSPGDLVFVSPDRPATTGDAVIIQTRSHDGAPIECWIKILVKRSHGEVVARQLNPETEISYRSTVVAAVHRVLTVREMFGA